MKKRLKKLTAICLLSFLLISFGIGTNLLRQGNLVFTRDLFFII